ncbi:type II toxin-antitoxin system RelE/ParE family toxin [Enterobacter hormaechei]|uniref:type II toxin-antitoxin system RelE/ParE family toxin n=1 Tax=Enterobacter hormaechei TaxID=158836 RepID=UPI003D14C2F0
MSDSLGRKLDMLNAADNVGDLRSPPGNRFENLNPPWTGYSSIRVNEKYRLIFKGGENGVEDVYLDPHDYRSITGRGCYLIPPPPPPPPHFRIRRTPRSTRQLPLVPPPTLFRSVMYQTVPELVRLSGAD